MSSDELERQVGIKEGFDSLSSFQVLRTSVPVVQPATYVEPKKATETRNLILTLALIVSRVMTSSATVHVVLAAMIFASRLLTIDPVQNNPQFQVPGPSTALFKTQPYYTCNTNRYVATNGSSSNNGLTPATPWDIPTAVAWNASASGTGSWCVNVAPGSYDLTTSQLNVAHGGTVSTTTGYVVWRCTTMPFSFLNGVLQGEGNGCKLSEAATGGSYFMVSVGVGINFVMFEGFEITSNNNTNGGPCIDLENAPGAAINHHIWVLNSDLYNCGLSGLQWNYSDWLFAIHNVWHDNALSTTQCNMGSGLSFFKNLGFTGYTPTVGNPDYFHSSTTGRTYNMVIAYNVGYRNYNSAACAPTTDGEGIILDTFDWGGACNVGTSGATCPYNGNALIMGNIMWGNGGNGIEAVFMKGPPASTAHIDVVNNTTYSNGWDSHNTGTFGAGLLANQAVNSTWWNNIAITVSGSRTCVNTNVSCSALDQVSSGAEDWHANMTFPSGNLSFDANASYPTAGLNPNSDGTDPKLASLNSILSPSGTGTSNFSLQLGSPAIGFGRTFDLWQQSGTIDAGACVHQLTSCP